MLMANKTERGKKKVADRWESTVYTVMDHKPDTHTYRIRNPATGQKKVVHRNLLMLVKFLPVNVDGPTSDHLSDVSSPCQSSPSVSSLHVVENEHENEPDHNEVDGSSSVAMDASVVMQSKALSMCADIDHEKDSSSVQDSDSRSRTACWVSRLPESCSQHGSDQTLGGAMVDPSAIVTFPAPDSHIPEISGFTKTPTSGGDTRYYADSRKPDSVDSVLSAQPNAQVLNKVADILDISQTSRSVSPVKSRFGRIIRPVDRLIHVMSGQVVQDTKQNVKAVCKSVFRAFSA